MFLKSWLYGKKAVPLCRMNNPYVVRDAKVKRRVRLVAVTTNPMDIVNTATGEVERATPYVGKRQWRDIGEFTKVYSAEVVFGLSVYAFRVMHWIWSVMDFEGAFAFDADACAERIGVGRRHAFRGLKELKEKDIVRKNKGSLYWFNPNIAFRGSRDDLLDL